MGIQEDNLLSPVLWDLGNVKLGFGAPQNQIVFSGFSVWFPLKDSQDLITISFLYPMLLCFVWTAAGIARESWRRNKETRRRVYSCACCLPRSPRILEVDQRSVFKWAGVFQDLFGSFHALLEGSLTQKRAHGGFSSQFGLGCEMAFFAVVAL